jgi:hypothetical protein
MAHKFKVGDRVMIQGHLVSISTVLTGTDGGYLVDPPVQNVRYWKEDEMEEDDD